VVDDMMVEMRQMQQENMVSVVLKVDDRTGILRILSNNHNIMLPLQKMPSQSTTQAPSKQSPLKLMNEGMQFCLQEHELAIAYEPEDDSTYCRAPYFLYNVKCKGCGKQFVERLTDESSEYKPSTKNAVYKCIGSTRGCKITLCKNCYVKLPMTKHRGGWGR